MIQGRADNPNHWVSKISIEYFEEISNEWESGSDIGFGTWVKERGLKYGQGVPSMFTIPNNKSNKICFDDAVFARYIKIYVHEWNGWPAMRAGALLRDHDSFPCDNESSICDGDDSGQCDDDY